MPNLPYNMKPSGLLSIFMLLVNKGFKQRRLHNFIRKLFIVVPLAVQNSLVLRDGSLEVVVNVCFACTQSNRVVNLLIVDVHFNTGKDWVQKVVYMSNERNWGLLLSRRLFFICFYLIFELLFSLLCYCKLRNHDPWQVSVSMPITSVSIQRISSDKFEIQTLCSFHRVR